MNGAALLLRADTSPKLGIGHTVRSLALAQAWQDAGGNALLVTASSIGGLPKAFSSGTPELRMIPAAHPDPRDLKALLELVAERRAQWVSCDGYHFDAQYTAVLQERGVRVLLIDDIAHASFYRADVLLNQNIFAERLSYHADAETRFLLGPRYALLRAEFRRWAGWRREIPSRARHLVVVMGGSDRHNQTARVVDSLQPLTSPEMHVKIVIGASNSSDFELEKRRACWPAGQCDIVRNPDDLPVLFAWADLAISAAGSTCWELCCLGVPSILLTCSDNQAGIARGLAEVGAAEHLGWFDKVTDTEIGLAVGRIMESPKRREQLSGVARSLVDGQGALRVTTALRGGGLCDA